MSTTMQDNTSALSQLDEQLRSLNSYTSSRMPIIELTSISTDGTKIPSPDRPHQFNFRIVGGGSIREGDEIQLCYRTLTSKKKIFTAEDGTETSHRTYKYKYRPFWSKVIDNPIGAISGGIYIRLAPEWDVDAGRFEDKCVNAALMHDQRNSHQNIYPSIGYIYLRIKRRIGDDPEQSTAIYSNVIPIGKTSTDSGEIRYYI